MSVDLDLTALTDAGLDWLRVAVRAEQEARMLARSSVPQAEAVVAAITSGLTTDPIVVERDGKRWTVSIEAEPAPPQGPAEWEPDVAYAAGTEVTRDGQVYVAKADTPIKPPGKDPTWEAL